MRDRRALAARLAPAALLVLLAAAWLVPSAPGLDLAGESDAPEAWDAALDALPARAIVLVAFDPDLGTYAEIRPTVRAALADLLTRDYRLALVSLTPEGRALALAEMTRLDRGAANPRRWIDLGFVPGAEAAIVEIARSVRLPAGSTGEIVRRLRDGGSDAIEGLLVVGGNELGPRSWVEQYLPRAGDRPLLAVAPTVLLPELLPYVETGQVDALLATPRDGAAYRASVALGRLDQLADAAPPRSLPVLAGLVVAIAIIGSGLVRRVGPLRRRGTERGDEG